uniref:Osteopetrosis-associated transmembrane protein 1 n=2 Tax=Arion vulgaris TaxID=1028688 RepID=A0A0B7AYT2_9EUPU
MVISTSGIRFSCTLLVLTIQLIFLNDVGKCNTSVPAESPNEDVEFKLHYGDGISKVDYSNTSCESIYQKYLTAVVNFTQCEIHHVRPFRLCLACKMQYQVAEDLYLQLNSNPDLDECKTKYMMSDKVQIIPTVQTNMDKIWRTSHCHRCYSQNGTMRGKVSEFLNLAKKLNVCINATVEEDPWSHSYSAKNSSDVCIQCRDQYVALNADFNTMYNNDAGDVCMDIMNMMNYTRIHWSLHFNCTAGSYDSTPVIIVSCFVACTPILFYVYLRITGKVRRAKLFKHKRLTSSTDASSGSHSTAGSPNSTN